MLLYDISKIKKNKLFSRIDIFALLCNFACLNLIYSMLKKCYNYSNSKLIVLAFAWLKNVAFHWLKETAYITIKAVCVAKALELFQNVIPN